MSTSPLAVAAALWALDDFEAEELAQLLDDVSLARFSLRTGTLRLHDLIRAYAASRLDDPASAHRVLALHLATPPEPAQAYAWRWRPYHLVHAGQTQSLCELLADPDWLLAKLRHTDVVALGEDFDLAGDASLTLVQQAIRLAAAALASDAAQLPGQLLARLPADPALDSVQALRERVAASRSVSWLRPLRALSTPAGSPNTATLLAHDAPVLCLALSDDGSLLASGAADGTLRLWDWRRGKPMAVMAGHAGRLRSLAFAADGEQLASIGDDATLRAWDCRTGQAAEHWPLHVGPLQQVLAGPSPDAPWWVVAGGALWQVQANPQAEPRQLIGPQASLDALAQVGAGLLIGACGQRVVRLWQWQAEAWQEVWRSRLPHLSAVATATAASAAFSVGHDGALRRWTLDAWLSPDRTNGLEHLAGLKGATAPSEVATGPPWLAAGTGRDLRHHPPGDGPAWAHRRRRRPGLDRGRLAHGSTGASQVAARPRGPGQCGVYRRRCHARAEWCRRRVGPGLGPSASDGGPTQAGAPPGCSGADVHARCQTCVLDQRRPGTADLGLRARLADWPALRTRRLAGADP